jgi:hypothetical protein
VPGTQLAAAEALAQDGALILGDGALDLQQELVVGVVGDGPLDEDDRAAGAAQFFEDEHLVGVLARESVGGEDGDQLELPRARRVTQRVEAGRGVRR